MKDLFKRQFLKHFTPFVFWMVVVAVLMPVAATAASYLYVANNGDIGIGTDNPVAMLDVVGAIYSRLVTPTDASSLTIDWNQGNVQGLTLNTSNTTLAFTNGHAGGDYELILYQDATGGRTVTWPATVEWPNGNAPTLTSTASSTDVVKFVYDGSNYLGISSLNYETAPTSSTIAYDNSAFFSGSSSTNFSNSYTTGSGADRFMIAEVFDGGDLTGVTYGGISLTKIGSTCTSEPYSRWYLYGPASGANNFVVTSSGSEPGRVVVATYSGVAQSGFPDASSSLVNSFGTTSVSVAATPVASGAWGILIGAVNNPFSSTNYTDRVAGSSGDAQIIDTNGTISGLTGMTMTQVTSSDACGVMYTIAPF
jgi:hypothetical protein